MLTGYHEHGYIDFVQRVRQLELEDIGIPTGHIAELHFDLESPVLVVAFQTGGGTGPSPGRDNGRLQSPTCTFEMLVERSVERFLVHGKEEILITWIASPRGALPTLHASPPCAQLKGIEEWHRRLSQDLEELRLRAAKVSVV